MGKPLLAYSVEALQNAHVTDLIIVSTESSKIAAVAREYGVRVIDRPAAYATDSASTESVLLHVLDVLNRDGIFPEHVLTVPPTSPLRTASTVKNFVAAYLAESNRIDAMLTLTEDRGVFWTSAEEGRVKRLLPDAPRRRQERKPLFEENSALYVTRVEALRATGSVLGEKTGGFVIDPVEAVDINEPFDLAWAEFLLSRQQERRTAADGK